MSRDHFGLGAGEGRVLGQHRLGDGAVQVSPPLLEQRFIGGILDKRMVEGDPDAVILAMLAGEASFTIGAGRLQCRGVQARWLPTWRR